MPSAPAHEILDRVADEPYVTTATAAKAIGVGVSTLQRWAARGLVTPALRTPGGQARWDVEDLKAQLRVPGPPPGRDAGGQPGPPG
jgi:MerR HTH family regulatory protein